MALFESAYTPPGVYDTVVFNATTTALSGNNRIPVLIGEGQQTFTQSNVELHRGSSATADDQIVGENLSNQVNGETLSYQLSHYPVVTGDGSGTVTNDPSYIQMVAGALPVNVLSLNGATGVITVQTIIPIGTNASVSYFFKKTDSKVLNENFSAQVPAFATFPIVLGGTTALTLTLSTPGYLGNSVTLALLAGQASSDAQAIGGAGTNAITINITNASGGNRTVQDLINLVSSGIPTLSGGYLVVASSASGSLATALTAIAATSFVGGAGQSTNTSFFTENVPVVDGSNGGVVTTDPTKLSVTVNGTTVPVFSIDGATGLFTLATGVPYGATGLVTYYTNTYQNTSDTLPASNVASIIRVGYGPGLTNFTQGVDYVLSGNSISWGASASTVADVSTPGYTPIDASVINTTLIDEKVYLRPCTGTINGINSVFSLEDVPVDGSGLGRPTNNASLIKVYVGTNPVTAAASNPVVISSLNGAAAQVTLFNPPVVGSGNGVFATYYRTILNDHEFTVKVDVPGIPRQGTFQVTDELGAILPVTSIGAASVTEANFTDTGIVWPGNVPDLEAAIGGADETVTITFQNDNLTIETVPATQATVTLDTTLKFTFSLPGTAGNAITVALISGGSGAADASAITLSGQAVSVELLMADGTTVRTWQQVENLFSSFPVTVDGGTVLCTAVTGANLATQATAVAATALAGGTAGTSIPYADRYLVTTSRTAQQAAQDRLGLTGGATTPTGSNTTLGASGYLGQTYDDVVTGVKFTIVDPHEALSYGYTQLPSPSYYYQAGDTLKFAISREQGFITGSPIIAIPGLQTTVVTTLGMNPGDTAVVSTFDRAANEPAVGEYYYIDFTTTKQASDYGLQTFSLDDEGATAFAAYGQPNTVTNRLSIAIQLLVDNGATQVACIQVPVQQGLYVASDQSFIDAINSLNSGLANGVIPNVFVPLSTSATVQQALNVYLTKQAAPRQRMEAIGFVGFNQYTTPTLAAATAQAIDSNRVIAVMPGAVGYMISAQAGAASVENLLTGEFVAAAIAGLYCSPAIDVATTLTNKQVVGFSRSLIQYDGPTKDTMAAAGITVLNDVPGALEVRHYKTTDPSNPLTSEPYVTTISDFIAQAFRKSLKQFIGQKITSTLPSSIEAVGNSLLNGYMGSLITACKPVVAAVDSDDPTTIDVSVSYVPMFSLLYVNVTFTVNITQ